MPTSEETRTKHAEARAGFRKAVKEAEASGKVTVEREKGRQRRSVERTRSRERTAERQASEAARQQTVERRVQLRQAEAEQRAVQKLQTQRDLASVNRQERLKTQVVQGGVGAVSSGTSSIRNTFGLIAVLFFVMIFLYVIVKNGAAFGALTGSVGNFIHGLSSNKPLFVSTSQG